MEIVDSFWSKVEKGPSCWEWIGCRNNHGYGTFRAKMAHRFSYELLRGTIPMGLTLHHACENPPCVNPDHLEVMSHRENLLRSPRTLPSIAAARTHCIRGHAFDTENTHITRLGKRKCRACDRLYHLKAYRGGK